MKYQHYHAWWCWDFIPAYDTTCKLDTDRSSDFQTQMLAE